LSKDKHPDTNIEHTPEPNDQPGGMKDSFIQNPDHNNQIHKEALGPNAKR